MLVERDLCSTLSTAARLSDDSSEEREVLAHGEVAVDGWCWVM